MKFGGTSVADARRMLQVAEIVRAHRQRRPVLVVSALAGVTDLLERALQAARRGEVEALEPLLADLARRHRWVATGAIEQGAARHDLNLAIDALFEDLRQLLRSVRVLGELTPRAADAVLSFGETLSARIATAVLAGRSIDAVWVDPREVIVTDDRHGRATPDLDRTGELAEPRLRALVESGRVPVLGGFVGSTAAGETTTLGRGGSDTSAAVLGCVLGAEEIQIWTDVPGMMSADPKTVPAARTLERITFAEAAELAFYGARVLHPATIAPAVARRIPVRVLSSLDLEAPGTSIVGSTNAGAAPLAAVAWRGGVRRVRVTSRRLHMDPGFLPRALAAFDAAGMVPDLVVSSEVAVTLVVREDGDVERARHGLEGLADVEAGEPCAMLTVVGNGLARDAAVRGRVLAALAALEPELVALGGSARSVSAVLPADRIEDGMLRIHRQFFEEERAP